MPVSCGDRREGIISITLPRIRYNASREIIRRGMKKCGGKCGFIGNIIMYIIKQYKNY